MKHVILALGFLGMVEEGANRGPWIDRWNRFVGSPLGSPYCAAFVSWCLWESEVRHPRLRTGVALRFAGVSPSYEPLREAAREGVIIVWRRGSSGWQGHVGFLIKLEGDVMTTVEANTSPPGGRWRARDEGEGNGVWKKTRSWRRNVFGGNAFRVVRLVPVLY